MGWRTAPLARPFPQFEELRKRWPAIEAAALRSEPEERRRRQDERKAAPDFARVRAAASEKHRRRYPVLADTLPPLDRPLLSHEGAVTFVEITIDVVAPEIARERYPWSSEAAGDLIWALWWRPSHDECMRAWPSSNAADAAERTRG